jgi:hypothetical protein
MKVKIRKAELQIPDSGFIRVEAKLMADSYDDFDECLWTLRSANPDVLLKHSSTAYEETYLNYSTNADDPNKFSPLIQITLPDANTHSVEILSKTINFVTKEFTETVLDDNNVPYENVSPVVVAEEIVTISNPLTIKLLEEDDGWV